MSTTNEIVLNIEGMHCASCVSRIEAGVGALDGVKECRVNLATRSGLVIFENSVQDRDAVFGKVTELGFSAVEGELDILTSNERDEAKTRRQFIISLSVALPLMIISMWPMFFSNQLISPLIDAVLQAILAAVVLFYTGWSILKDAFTQIKHLAVNMNSLITIGTLTAYGWSSFALYKIYNGSSEMLYFESAGMIITLILLGRFLESKAKRKAGSAVEELLKMRPTVTTAIINNVELEIEVATVQPGMILLVKPGEKVPADGKISEGSPVIDESLLSGESIPVEKTTGEQITGGSINGNTPFKMEVTKTGEESFLASIIRLVSSAQSSKAPIQRLADKVASVFVPAVLLIAVITGLLWFWLDPESPMAIKSIISVLIIACPCALGLATPTAVLAGSGRGAKEGIIVKGGDILERLSEIDAIIFDKTGTLTKGELEVISLKTFGHLSEQAFLRIVGSVEAQSEHPVAVAIYRYMKQRQVEPLVVRNAEARPGLGMVADCDGRRIHIGNKAHMESEKISFGPSLLQGQKEMKKGRTVVFVAMDGQVVGMLALADQIRGDAKALITALDLRMKKVAMISGDNRETAQGVAKSLGLEHFEAEIKPDQKQMIVESYRRAGYKVAMVGDGINDAPALAEANVGIAIGSGTDVAIETADVVLIRSELATITRMLNLSVQTMKTIRQNLFWAFFYNIIAIPLAAGLFYNSFGLSLTPMVAALAMSLSSVFVVSNSLRLNTIEL